MKKSFILILISIFSISMFAFPHSTHSGEEESAVYLSSDQIQIRFSDRSRTLEVDVLTHRMDRNLEVVLFDALGNKVYHHRWEAGAFGKTVTASLSDLNSGIFFVRVLYGNEVFTTGITIQNGGA